MGVTSYLGVWQLQRYKHKLYINDIYDKDFRFPIHYDLGNVEPYKFYKITGTFDYNRQFTIGPKQEGGIMGKYVYIQFSTQLLIELS